MIILLSAACSSITDPKDKYAKNAHIQLTGTSAVPLLLVTSTNWYAEVDPETGNQRNVIVAADTLEVTTLPAERTVALAPTYRILVRVVNPSKDAEADVRLRVRLDGDLVYDESAKMRDAWLEYTFTYW
jgi:hypothetical protein